MKPATKTAIVITCILLATALLFPPWTSLGTFKGFHLITGSYFAGYFITPQIDYARLIMIIFGICVGSVAMYFIGTSAITHNALVHIKNVFSSLKYNSKPVRPILTWVEKNWIWVILLVILVKFAL